ncbi:MAG: toxin-antitoxin system YwqK family antitoxin [Alphaproteobacteria bacterium]|nr:toxin-antitoxin system YwqK family antitoxin [Alphaproteobacteria bacterium]
MGCLGLIAIFFFVVALFRISGSNTSNEKIDYDENTGVKNTDTQQLSRYEKGLIANCYTKRFGVYKNIKEIAKMENTEALHILVLEMYLIKKDVERELKTDLLYRKHLESKTIEKLEEARDKAFYQFVKYYKKPDYQGENSTKMASSIWLILLNSSIPRKEKNQLLMLLREGISWLLCFPNNFFITDEEYIMDRLNNTKYYKRIQDLEYDSNELTEFYTFIYKGDHEEGEFKEYYKDGTIKSEENYNNFNEFDGLQKYYYETGIIKEESFYKDGIQNGLEKKYHENGQLRYETNYVNGENDHSYKTYYENGKIESETCYKDGDMKHIEYDENGNIKSEW